MCLTSGKWGAGSPFDVLDRPINTLPSAICQGGFQLGVSVLDSRCREYGYLHLNEAVLYMFGVLAELFEYQEEGIVSAVNAQQVHVPSQFIKFDEPAAAGRRDFY